LSIFSEFSQPKPVLSGQVYVCSDHESFEDAAELAKLNLLNEKGRSDGWRVGVASAYGESLLHYVDNPDRLVFLPLLPIKSTDVILEIGPGLGQNAIPIAKAAATVDIFEIVRGQAEFCALRCEQEDITNIRIAVGGASCTLPYADGVFDGVVLNLVLEWCGNRSGSASHDVMQQKMLREIARVLKPGGFLYLVTKNRFALRLLVGGRDEHMSQMRFGSSLPRWLSRLMLSDTRPAGHLHSYNALQKHIKSAGFVSCEAFWALPEMRWPKHIISFDAPDFKQIRKSNQQGDTRLTRFIMPWLPKGLVRHFSAGHVFLARKM
jgi:SAM-dependent methyltransferase